MFIEKNSSRYPTPTHLQTEKGRKEILRQLVGESRSFKLKEQDYLDVATQIWAGIDTPRSLTCHLLHKYGEYGQLVNLQCSPSNYHYDALIGTCNGRDAFTDDYLATSLLAKWPNFQHVDLDPVSACIQSDSEAELSCLRSNHRLTAALYAPSQENSAHLHKISLMQADIARVLGGFDPVRWLESCRFGPGKAQGQKGSLDLEKLISEPSSTCEFLPVGVALISESTPWLEAVSNSGGDPFSLSIDEEEVSYRFDAVIEPGDRNIMVPKNAKTMRGIRPQPGINVYAQLGIGRMIRTQLQKSGLDLDDQGPNQALAKIGSGTFSDIVTIDLKGASGHICRVLPRILLQDDAPRWLHAMELCRTRCAAPHGVDHPNDDEYSPLHSYSAMGNGYTFELETLIFWSAVRACRRVVGDTQQYRVYGDDIICSREVADELIPFLQFLGFPINAGKTFLEGPFRESCGADYWRGTNIRPIHFSTSVEEINEANANGTSILRWLQTCNAIRRLARRRNHGFGCDRRLLAGWRTAVLRIPRNLRDSLKSPWDEIRDDSLITHYEDACSNPLVHRCNLLQYGIGPRLSVRTGELPVPRFFGAKAVLLYRRSRGDEVCLRFDRTRSWLRRVLQAPNTEQTALQNHLQRRVGIKTPSTLRPNLHAISLGAGWEVFQPVGEVTEWLLID